MYFLAACFVFLHLTLYAAAQEHKAMFLTPMNVSDLPYCKSTSKYQLWYLFISIPPISFCLQLFSYSSCSVVPTNCNRVVKTSWFQNNYLDDPELSSTNTVLKQAITTTWGQNHVDIAGNCSTLTELLFPAKLICFTFNLWEVWTRWLTLLPDLPYHNTCQTLCSSPSQKSLSGLVERLSQRSLTDQGQRPVKLCYL